jgi:hypothetical protein
MGLFGFLNREVRISLDDAMEFLQDASGKSLGQQHSDLSKISKNIENAREDITSLLKEIPENVPGEYTKRELQIMQGNREVYIKKTLEFLRRLDVQPDILSLGEHSDSLEKQLNDYHAASSRAYYVMTHFCDDVMKEIASRLKMIETAVLKLRQLSKDEKVVMLKALKSAVNDLTESIEQKKNLEKAIEEAREELAAEEAKLEALKEKKRSLKDSKDYSEFAILDSKKKQYEEEISRLNSRLLNDLDIFSRAAKKFSRGDNLMAIYLDDPLKALSNDPNLEIMRIIEKIRLEISFGHLDVKQKDKLLHHDLGKEHFEKVREEYDSLKKARSETVSRQSRLSIMMDYKEIEYMVENHENKVKRLKGSIEEKNDLLAHLNIEAKISRLEEKASQLTGRKVIIENIK